MFNLLTRIKSALTPKTAVAAIIARPAFDYACDCGGTATAHQFITDTKRGPVEDWEGVCLDCESWGMKVNPSAATPTAPNDPDPKETEEGVADDAPSLLDDEDLERELAEYEAERAEYWEQLETVTEYELDDERKAYLLSGPKDTYVVECNDCGGELVCHSRIYIDDYVRIHTFEKVCRDCGASDAYESEEDAYG